MKNFKKVLAVFLAALTIFSVTPLIEATVPVAPIVSVAEAKSKVKLNKKKLTLIEGNSYKLKVKGTKKKVKWSSSNKKIATVKKGKVVAKKAGKATITAKVGKKKYKCKVTVKPIPINVKNIAATYYQCTNSKSIVAVLKNNNKRAVDVHLSVVFYDAKGNIIDTYGDSNYCFEAGRTCALHVIAPSDGYATYKTKLTVDESFYAKKTYVKNISISHHNVNDTGSSVLVENENIGSVNLDTVRASILYYDANGRVIDYEYTYFSAKKAGDSAIDSFSVPYDKNSSNYDKIKFASYKIFIDHAYVY